MNNAKFDIGYSINKTTYYKVQKQDIDIGAYGVTYNIRSHYIWRTSEKCEGYIIRKENWLSILTPGAYLDKDASKLEVEQNMDLCALIRKNIKFTYKKYIESIIKELKENDMNKLKDRADFGGIILLATKK
jgi:hypothetical protein